VNKLDLAVDFPYADDLACEDLAQVDLAFADADATTASNADGSVMER